MVVDYNHYTSYITDITNNDVRNSDFKSNYNYRGILEHVTQELGLEYIKLIEDEFPQIQVADIIGYLQINDKYGLPRKYNFEFSNGVSHSCSPTSLRYVYHALTILEHYKNTNCENIVEVGCGYGGLCLAINYFSNLNNICVKKYNIVDMPEVCNLIEKYLEINRDTVEVNVKYHHSTTYGKNIIDSKLFFISNYCYTEIDKNHNDAYSSILLPKTNNGFITWQNGGNNGSYPVNKATQIIGKEIINVVEEKPQTDAGYGIYKNYFVYF